MKTEIEERFHRNVSRVENLVTVYTSLRAAGKGRRRVSEADVLRAATVLLHAALEDSLRSVLAWRLPSASDAAFDRMALPDTEGKTVKFGLQELAAHRGKTVHDILRAAITEHLARQTFSDTKSIVSAMTAIGLDKTPLEPFLPSLDGLIQRRHNIVHRADRNEKAGRGQFHAQSIGKDRVVDWLAAVKGLVKEALRQADGPAT